MRRLTKPGIRKPTGYAIRNHTKANSQMESTMKNKLNTLMLPGVSILATLLLSACGGGSGDGGDAGSGASNQSAPLLQAGMNRQFAGSATRTITYANPTATNINNTLAYTFTEVQNVLQAPANAPAAFDINSAYTYNITQDPGTGTVPVSQTVDDYRNLIVSGNSQATVDVAQSSTVVNSDESANAAGGGPYLQTTTTGTTYSTPRTGFFFPLQAGATMNVAQSSVQNITFTDLNAGGAAPSNGSGVGYSRSRTENDDGSFSFQQTGATGVTETLAENPDGSAAYTITGPSSATTYTISTPALTNGAYVIPVNRSVSSASPSNNNYAAADWYPGNGLVPTPLVLSTQSVVGPVTSLPAQCGSALVQPNMFEIDTNTSNLSTVNASYAVTNTRVFNANGVAVCNLTQQTTYNYSLLTGALFSTASTQTVTQLTALN